MKRASEYPPIGDYALIGDCHSAALVSRQGSIDWCCLPRFDSDSCFGRMLDWNNGGYFQICPAARFTSRREYIEKSLVLVTTFRAGSAEARLIDFFAMRPGGRQRPRREIVRIIEGVSGTLRLHVRFVPRLDFGEVKPWVRPGSAGAYVAVGSNAGLTIFGDAPLHPAAITTWREPSRSARTRATTSACSSCRRRSPSTNIPREGTRAARSALRGDPALVAAVVGEDKNPQTATCRRARPAGRRSRAPQ